VTQFRRRLQISSEGASTQVRVIRTDEESMMAKTAAGLLAPVTFG
jgi:hypothetical protein